MKKQTYGIISLIASIVGLVGNAIPFVQYIAWAGPIVGLVFAILGRKQPDDGNPSTNGMLTAGLVISIISLAVSVACTACIICAGCGLAALGEAYSY
jgi:hypothetical protein